MVCFAANSVITRYLVLGSRVSPFLVTVVRFVSGLGTLLILGSVKPAAFRHNKPNSHYLLGAFFLGAYAFSISYGYLFIPVAAGTFVFYTFVVVTMVAYSIVVEGEKMTSRLLLGGSLGLLGVLVITFGRISSVAFLGVLLMAATGTSWGLYSAYGKSFERAFDYTYNSFLILGVGAICVSVLAWFMVEPVFIGISVQDFGLALYMGTVSTALSYVVWNDTVKKIPASLGGLVQLLVPIIAPIMGIVFLGEQLSATLLLGGALVMVGIYIVQLGRSSKR
jgi:drug/metabolite transporter (DMT)-like permease